MIHSISLIPGFVRNSRGPVRLPCVFLLTVLFSAFFIDCGPRDYGSDSDTLAVVGERRVLKADFIERYNQFRNKTGVTDTGQARRSLLATAVSEELLIHEASKRGYKEDAVGRQERERIEIQELLNAYHRRFIARRVNVNDEELRNRFVRMHTRIKARHIYARTRKEADSLHTLILQGTPFETLARETFEDPVLRESGGLIGYFTVDEMDPAFEDAAFALAIGEVSAPVRTSDGYSIIRVEDRTGNPLLRETDFLESRERLGLYWRRRKTRKATQSHVDSLRNILRMRFNEPMIRRMMELLRADSEKEFFEEVEISQRDFPEIENGELVFSSLGSWDVKTFQDHARFTTDEQKGRVRTEEDFKDFIAGLVVRSHMLSSAKKHRLHKTSEYRRRVSEHLDAALLERIQAKLYGEFTIPEDSLRAYYAEDPSRFNTQPLVRLSEIVVDDAAKAGWVAERLKGGHSFSDLARMHSTNRTSAERGGDIGYLNPGHLGKWSKTILTMREGYWIGPLKADEAFFFFKCHDQIPGRARAFEEARTDVEQTVRALWWERIRNDKLDEIRETVNVASYPIKLRTIQLN